MQHHSFCRKLPPLFIWYGWDLPSEQVSKLFYTVAAKEGFSPVINLQCLQIAVRNTSEIQLFTPSH